MLSPVFHVVHYEPLHTLGHLVQFPEETLFPRFGNTCDCGTGTSILFANDIPIFRPHALHNLKDLDIARDAGEAEHFKGCTLLLGLSCGV